MLNVEIRPIAKSDNPKIESVIRTVFLDMKIPLVGTTYEDPETSQMYESYNKDRAIYFVVEYKGEILGGAGISPLKNYDSKVCELQKMYSLPQMRGRGIGQQLLTACLQKAKDFGYDQCYLETIPMLKSAIKLYKKNGFQTLENQLGGTGHHNCNLWMIKQL